MQRITLAAARVTRGMTQAELANKMGVSRSIINKWETGKSKISTASLYAFCYVTGFKVDDIILPERSTKS